MKQMSIYLLRGGNEKTGYWLLPEYYNYKKHALEARKRLYKLHDLKVVKFVSTVKKAEKP